QGNAALLICSLGMTFVVLLGGFDLSVGAFLALGAVVMAKLLDRGTPTLLAICLVFALGLLAAAMTNAAFVAFLGFNFLVVTIATDALFSGLALVFSEGRTLPMYKNDFVVWLGTGSIIGIPIAISLALIVAAVSSIILNYTGFGR